MGNDTTETRRRRRRRGGGSGGSETQHNAVKRIEKSFSYNNNNNKCTTTTTSLLVLGTGLVLALYANTMVRYWTYRYLPMQDLWPIDMPLMTKTLKERGRLWGTYRPGVYFGVRAKEPLSTLMGLMWANPEDYNALHSIRHEAQQGDGLKKWGWQAHDGEAFGRQTLQDGDVGFEMQWIRSESQDEDWTSRIHAYPLDASSTHDKPMTFFVYFANQDGDKVSLDPAGVAEAISRQSRVQATGCSFSSSDWCAYIRPLDTFKGAVHYFGATTRDFHNLTDLVREGLVESLMQQRASGATEYSLVLPNGVEEGSNVGVIQITAVLPMTIDVAFVKGGITPHSRQALERAESLSGGALTGHLEKRERAFETKFDSIFRHLDSSYNVSKYALSNMLGGIGYWYGHSRVKVGDEVLPLWDRPLLSAVPSRPFFPRGFLWDEGFHQLLIHKWNPSISREILSHWLDLMAASGWIAREQILGMESRVRVPDEFVPQSPDAANPPTLFLVLSEMARMVSTGQDYAERENDLKFLKIAWPRLDAWFSWYHTSQSGPLPGSYRWRGRNGETDKELNPKTLTSGLDDYPRASHPSPDERHVDLRCWMALAARAMARISEATGASTKKQQYYKSLADTLEDYDELKKLHWDEEQGVFADVGHDTLDVVLEELVGANGHVVSWSRVINGSTPKFGFVKHIGYVTMFPLALQLIPKEAPEMHLYLDLLSNPNHIWSPFGLRSLSASSSLYNKKNTPHDPPYWRGAIWINMNYLTVRALRETYSLSNDPIIAKRSKELADALSKNIVSTISSQYEQNGFVYENYDDANGHGKGCHPFTGWTALVAML